MKSDESAIREPNKKHATATWLC